ncbi:MAG: hypothetical protein H6668_08650 [Ardenticatenaceae bacterium]|nr:hypothetical protein [Ardenticatenaceae bacterium]
MAIRELSCALGNEDGIALRFIPMLGDKIWVEIVDFTHGMRFRPNGRCPQRIVASRNGLKLIVGEGINFAGDSRLRMRAVRRSFNNSMPI